MHTNAVSKPDSMAFSPGAIIGGRYEVLKRLGTGGMGSVYCCRQLEIPDHIIAIKVLSPQVSHDKVALERFKNEMSACLGIYHTNVIRGYEFLHEGSLYAFGMEYISGGDLVSRLERGLSIVESLSILLQICAGVEAIHYAGIVHRDLKPENILMTEMGVVKITDFGIAALPGRPRLTEHGGVVGTLEYVSPEYIMDSVADQRSDIYAVGLLAYEMLTGFPPHQEDSIYETIARRVREDPEAPSLRRPEIPPWLDAIILTMLKRDPAGRFQTMTELLRALELGIKRSGLPLGIQNRVDDIPPTSVRIANNLDAPTVQAPAHKRSPGRAPMIPAPYKTGGEQTPLAGPEYKEPSAPVNHRSVDPTIGHTLRSARVVEEQQGQSSLIRAAKQVRGAVAKRATGLYRSSAFLPAITSPQSRNLPSSKSDPLPASDSPQPRALLTDIASLAAAVLIGMGVGFLLLRGLLGL
jgi:serine/threonine protein kinase